MSDGEGKTVGDGEGRTVGDGEGRTVGDGEEGLWVMERKDCGLWRGKDCE